MAEKPHDDVVEYTNGSDTDVANASELAKIDTKHNDEAVKVLASYSGDEHWTDEEEKRLRRKIDWKLIPILCITYLLQYYDKAMLSQAALFGIEEELGLTIGDRYSMSAAIFYLGFIAGAWPAIVIAQRFRIELVASLLVSVWGICLLLTIVCSNYQGIYVQRFFLGFLESGISPMFMMIVGSWYKKDEQAMRMGFWYASTGYSSIFSPLVNFALGHITGDLSPWKYMYIFAGCITTIWGVAVYFLLPPDPIRSKGFTERERYIAIARMRTNNSGVRNTHFKLPQLFELLLDLKFWSMFFIALLCMIANGPISAFLPIIIASFGFGVLDSLLLVMPVGFYAGTLMLILPYIAYKKKGLRAYLIFAAQMGTTLSALLLWKLPRSAQGGLMFAAIILPSVGAGYGVTMGLQIANIAGYTKRSLASSGLFVGYCIGNFIGPLVFLADEAPYYDTGFIIVVITSLLAGLLALFYRLLCVLENRKRDQAGIMEGFEHAYEDDLTDKKNKQFRYIL